MFFAQEEAQRCGSSYVSTEHLLLGLIHTKDNTACRALEGLGVDLDELRELVEAEIPPGNPIQSSDMTLTPRAKHVIDLAYDEARNLNHNYIGTEHLLLGLIREGEGVVGKALSKLGAKLDLTREKVATLTLYAARGDSALKTLKRESELIPNEDLSDEGVPKEERRNRADGWQRFTERARRVVFHAEEEAMKRGAILVTAEHLLLGLASEEDSVAANIFERLGVSLDKLRSAVEYGLPTGEPKPAQELMLSPQAKRVIDLAYDEARKLNNNYIGTEHLLLGIVREDSGFACRVLWKLGVSLELSRKSVMAIQNEGT